jgi:AraC-like DNA-binding protein
MLAHCYARCVLVDPPTFRRLVRARTLLAERASSVREIAAAVGLSQFHFIRVFGAVFGDTPHQFRTRVRVDRAKVLLARGTAVTEVCLEVGFASVPSFSALFTRWVGAPPSRYRRVVAVPSAPPPLGCFALLEQFWRSSPHATRA